MAKKYNISGTSKMKRDELLEAVKEQLDQHKGAKGDGQSKRKLDGVETQLQEKSKGDLYKLASEQKISGRSHMNKTGLMHALARQMQNPGAAARM